ncbi:flagellar biosynthetic protein FliO [Catenovulum agarivorans]|uniref:flagellar biosynthetic protein FliO n=1 Tax=Catenovulum agarivorans TaxID=1172192 RepID=UPI000377B2FA|nr:flagellar biosynthetic protein FliO [Catenovulum agarivorans]
MLSVKSSALKSSNKSVVQFALAMGLTCVSSEALAQSADLGAAIPTMLFGLCATIAVIYVLAGLARKTNLGQFKNSTMQVLAVLPLTAKEKLLLVQVGDSQLLLGVTSQSINLLKEFSEPLDIKAPDFKQSLSQFINANKKNND